MLKIEPFKYYVLRGNDLKEVFLGEIEPFEKYCYTTLTPSTPADWQLIMLLNGGEMTNNRLKHLEDKELRCITNMDYFNEISIKNFLSDKDEFKNYWEIN
jgi:hypothetical protein